MMLITFHSTPSIFQELEPEWLALLKASITNTPFQLPTFQAIWWRYFGEGQLCLLSVRTETGELVGIAPLFVSESGNLGWVGGEEIADYLDVIVGHSHEQAVRAAVWAWLVGAQSPSWHTAQLSNIPAWSETAAHWQALAQAQGWQSEVTQIDVCPVIDLPNDLESYYQMLDSKQRREIQRKQRRAEAEEGLQFHIVAAQDDIATASAEFLQLMRASHPDKAAFLLRPNMLGAFLELLKGFHQAGILQLAFLRLNGEAVAAYFNYQYANKIWVYNSGIDPNKASAFSPGWVLLAYLIAHAIEQGNSHFDFLQGDEDYKYRFGGRDIGVLRLRIEKSIK
jgi:CelD/BcsL family acetyltransferase involved in cellulose biosynthesis